MKKIIVTIASILLLVSLSGCKRERPEVVTPAPQPQPQPIEQPCHKEIITYADAQQERESGVLSDRKVEWEQEDFD